jgi:hypothetical protein
MKQQTYYTVITGKRSYIVKYATGPAYEVKLFSGAFTDAGSASQEFKMAVEGDPEYLAEKAFERKVDTLASLYKQDLAQLAAWNSGKAIRI